MWRLLLLAAALVAAGLLASPAASAYAPPPVPRGAVVFLGDSITRRQPWSADFPGRTVSDQGVGGDTAADVLARLDGIVAARPRAVFLLIGTNDLTRGVPATTVAARVDHVLTRLRAGSPATRLFVESVLPRQRELATRVRGLNGALRLVALRQRATWVDTHAALDDGSGGIRPAATLDGLHLSRAGQVALARAVAPFLRQVPEEPPHWWRAPGPQPLRRGRWAPHPQ
jgi:lysophospholipase L1-like esterase